MTGTQRYASVHTHYGSESSRRDDVESLGYVLIYLAGGILPWQSLTRVNVAEVGRLKARTTPYQLCKGLPHAYRYYMENVRALSFDQRPDYDLLASYFL
jgi:hypothetical protein